MRLSQTRTAELLGAIAAGCGRLVHPSVTDTASRLRQRRFLGIMLAGPFLVAVAVAIFFPPHLGVAMTLAAICATFGAGWLAAFCVAATGKEWANDAIALVLGTVALAAIVAAAGGLASPAALLIVALPFEACWLHRTSRAAFVGTAAALAVVPLQAVLGPAFFADATAISAGHWLLPLSYAGFVIPRIIAWLEEAASDADERFTPRLDEIIDGVVLRMADTGDVSDASHQARKILGVAPELLLSSGLFDRVHVADRIVYMSALADLRQGCDFKRMDVRLRVAASIDGCIAGDYRPFQIEMMRPSGSEREITAIIRTNGETAELRAALAVATDTAQSMEFAKSRFLGAVSHELRTPLNSIIGFSDMLLYEMFGGFSDPRQKEYVSLVRESGHHLLAVVNSILDVSKIESGAYATNPEPFRFRDAVDMCHSMLKHQAGAKGLDLSVDVSPETGEVHADRRAVQQMLINLVSNAIKFTPHGGRIVIGAKRIGSRLHFWVSDTGIGISADDLAQVGKPFMQIQNDYTRQFEGAGLGLSLVKGLVSLHNGTMAIESEPGDGTTVTISLPVQGPKRSRTAEEAEIVTMPASRAKEDIDGTFRKTA